MVQLGDTTGPNAGLSVPNVYWANASARVTGTAFPATNPLATYAYAPAYGSITSNCNISQVWFRTESGA